MSKVNIEIDGQKLQVSQGTMVIEAADNAGISIPRFCYHKKLSIAANCRMCLVQVENAPKPMPACATPVSEGMKVQTQSEYAKEAQKSVMEFLLINHPLDCPICDQGGQCELQDVALEYGKDVSRFTEGKRSVPDKDIGPLISTEMTRCIHCTRCVRFGQELAGMRELGATGRGEHMKIGTYIEQSVDSEVSGNVIDLCPVGALTSKPRRFKARAWEVKSRASIACHDAMGSNVFYHTYQNKVMNTVPRENEVLNEVWLSDRDRYSFEGLNHGERLLTPKIKQDGKWKEVSWEAALKHTAERLFNVIQNDGPANLGAIASPNSTTEEFYLLQKLLRSLGSKNIDSRLRMMDAKYEESYHPHFSQSLHDLENIQVIFLVGCHPRMEMPLLNLRLLKATKQNAKILSLQTFADKQRYPIEQEVLAPGGDLISSLAQITKAIIDKTGSTAPEPIKDILSNITVTESYNKLAQNLVQEGSKTIIIGEDILSHPQAGILRVMAATLAKALSAPLEECVMGANSMGGKLTGCLPHLAPMGHKTLDEPGLSAHQMMLEPLKAMILLNVEPEFDCINPRLFNETLKKVSQVICITPYETDVMKEYADILLPMVPITETDGTLVNMFGALQSFRAVTQPQGEARPAWKILRVLGNFLHLEGFNYSHCEDVLEELKQGFEQAVALDDKRDAILKMPVDKSKYTPASLVRLSPLSMYRVDAVVRRAHSLQRTNEARASRQIFINPETAKGLQFKSMDVVKVVQDSRPGAASYTVMESTQVPAGCVLLYAGHDDRCDLGAPFTAIELNSVSEG